MVRPHCREQYVHLRLVADDVPTKNPAVQEFGFSLDQVNWLGTCINLTYLPCAVIVPMLYTRLGLRRTVSLFIQCIFESISLIPPPNSQCYIGGALLVASSWIRYAGSARGLTSGGAYSLMIIGQVCPLALSSGWRLTVLRHG